MEPMLKQGHQHQLVLHNNCTIAFLGCPIALNGLSTARYIRATAQGICAYLTYQPSTMLRRAASLAVPVSPGACTTSLCSLSNSSLGMSRAVLPLRGTTWMHDTGAYSMLCEMTAAALSMQALPST